MEGTPNTTTERLRNPESRAQMLLVGALALAALIVGLALVLNSAIYTENLATRSEQTDVARSLGFGAAAEQAGDRAVRYVNHNNHTDYDDLNDTLVNETAVWRAQAAAANSRSGQLVSVRMEPSSDVKAGTRLVQRDNGTFRPYNNRTTNFTQPGLLGFGDYYEDEHWLAADDIRARNYSFQLARAQTTAVNETEAVEYLEDFEDENAPGKPFTVAVDADGDNYGEYRIGVYRDTTNMDRLNVTVYDDTDGSYVTCRPATGGVVTLDITGGTFGGVPCVGLEFLADLSIYELHYVNPDSAGGNYTLVVNRSVSGFENEYSNYGGFDTPYAPPGSSSEPGMDYALYSVEYHLTYRTGSVTYERTVRVAPGEDE